MTGVWRLNLSVGRSESSESVFTDEYVMGGVDAAYLDEFECVRSDDMKVKAAAVNGPAGVKVMAALQLVIPKLATLPAASS